MQNQELRCDVAIIGGSFGGVAAAQAILARGLRVVLTEEFPWIGGQVTSQALCSPDEYHDPVSECGGYTRRYWDFREALRTHYREKYRLSEFGRSQIHFSPSGGTKNISGEPHVAREILEGSLQKFIDNGQLTIRTEFVPQSAERNADRLLSVTCRHRADSENQLTIRADFFLSADETGELLPIAGVPFRLGTESRDEFDEPHAPEESQPDAVQGFTYCVATEFVPGGDFTIEKPSSYEKWKEKHGHWFYINAPGSKMEDPAKMFTIRTGRGGIRIKPAFYYRSMRDARNFDDPSAAYSRTIFNVNGNDYSYANFIGKEEKDSILEDARQLSLSYLYWLQTEAPRDDGGMGYPELRPLPEVTGAPLGLAMAPYIREGRRLKACRTIIEQDISTASQPHARAKLFADTVGVGCFLIDIHARQGSESISQAARPYQIPLGSLVCEELSNFAVAGKGIGVTQITNGAYRLHPIEWNIGEAAGELAAYCLETGAHPRLQSDQLFAFQRRLLQAGFTLFWYEDVPLDQPGFEAIQILSARGVWPASPRHLRFNPHYSIVRSLDLYNYMMDRLENAGVDIKEFRERHEVSLCTRLYDLAHRLMLHLDRVGWPEFAKEDQVAAVPRQCWKIFDELIPEPMDERALPGQKSALKE